MDTPRSSMTSKARTRFKQVGSALGGGSLVGLAILVVTTFEGKADAQLAHTALQVETRAVESRSNDKIVELKSDIKGWFDDLKTDFRREIRQVKKAVERQGSQ